MGRSLICSWARDGNTESNVESANAKPYHTNRRGKRKYLVRFIVFRGSAEPTLHGQDDAEFRLAAHHARVSLGRFFQRIGFNHGAHAGELGEVQSIFGVRG
jgi:hypothetical protein